MKLSLNTIIIFVRDIDIVKSFYTDILQLHIIEEYTSQWVLLNAGTANIGLHKIGEPYASNIANGYKFDNNTKMVFETREDIYTLRASLLQQGVSVQEVKIFDNYDYWLCDGQDPEGNIFQLKQKK